MDAKAQHLCSLIRRTDRGAIFHSSEQQSQVAASSSRFAHGWAGSGFCGCFELRNPGEIFRRESLCVDHWAGIKNFWVIGGDLQSSLDVLLVRGL